MATTYQRRAALRSKPKLDAIIEAHSVRTFQRLERLPGQLLV